MLVSLPMLAQERTVSGTVLDTSGEPIIGATVRVEGTTTATVTDLDGAFKIKVAAKQKLRISFVGYKDALLTPSGTSVKVTMQEDQNIMDEVVVVGYGTQKKATLTGAVSAITNKEMTVTKNESAINMLSGKIPGVRITQMSSQPGKYDNVIDIRGLGDPLIVVDGIARDKDYFGRMDANEIESVSVLKDASAAIYGVRAANGVILVTTKHGTSSGEDKFDVSLQANFGWQNFLYVPHTASAVDHMLLMNEKTFNNFGNNYPYRTTSVPYSYDQMLQYSQGLNADGTPHAYDRGTDWNNELFDKNVPQKQYNLSVNGSSKKIDYFVNLGFLDHDGNYKSGSLNYNRWNFRSNVDARITDRIKLGVSISGYMDERNEPWTGNSDLWEVYKLAWILRPTAKPYINGEPAWTPEFIEQNNPVATTNSAYVGFYQEKKYNFNGAISLTYDFKYVKGLTAKAYYSYDYNTSNNTSSQNKYYLRDDTGGQQDRNMTPALKRWTNPSYGRMMQLSLNYNRKFGDHNVSALALLEETYNYWEDFSAQATMLFKSNYLSIGSSTENQIVSGSAGDMTRRAWIGRVNYDWKGRYLIEFAFREDASSRWSAGHRWGFFPSVSAGWRISEEPWMKKLVPFLSNLKIRASYGKMGDDAGAGNYPPTSIGYNTNNDYGWMFGSGTLVGVTPTSIPNPNLTWYTAKTANFGIDWDLWDGKFGGTFELFQRKRSGLLATSSTVIPGTVGADLPQENLESDMTYGWEISLTHRNRVAGVNYWVSAQISATKNRWDNVLDNLGDNSYSNWKNRLKASNRNKDIWFSIEEGGRYGSYDDIWNNSTPAGSGALPGDYYYKDWNGDGQIDWMDEHPMATYNMPIFNYGITLGAEWKGIDFSMNWQGAAGVYNAYNGVFAEVCPFNGMAALEFYTDRWHTKNVNDDPWNPNTEWVAGLYPATGHSFTDYETGIQNTSYLRLKTLEVGYTFPTKWLKPIGIKSLRFYVNAYNLLTFTGVDNIDPERPGSMGINGSTENSSVPFRYPVNRTFNVGVNLKF